MSVWCRQSGEGIPTEEYVIGAEAHPDLGGDDLALLQRKARGAADKGWDVEWLGERRFVARKVRWQESVAVTREFWVG